MSDTMSDTMSDNKAYVLTMEVNAYDQFGEYFVAWFHSKPIK